MKTTVTTPSSMTTATMTRRDRVALGLLVSAQFLVMLDTSIVNVALPSIQSELGFGPAAVTWVVNAYVLAFAGLLLLSGRAADLFGRRRVFVVGASLFTVGTLLAAVAVTKELLILGRVVQGIGAAGLSPAAMSLLLVTFPAAQRARAMGAWGAASTLGGATGVVSGGVLAGTVGWRAVFLVTVPVSLAAIALARRVLVEDAPGVRRTVDWAGAAAVTGAVITLVHGAVDAVDHAWTSPRVVGLFAVSSVLMAAFIAIERRAADPLVPLELFRSRMLRTGTAVALLGGASRASTFVLVALYFQQVLAMSPEQAGFAMVPTSLTGFAVSLAVLPRVLGAIGPVRSMVLGLVVLAAGHLWLANAPTGSGVRRRRPPGPAPRRDGRRPQLHPHHHGPHLCGARQSHRSGVRARRRLDAGRWRTRDGRLHRHRHLVRSSGRRRPRRRGLLRSLHRSRGRRAAHRCAGSDARAASLLTRQPRPCDRGDQVASLAVSTSPNQHHPIRTAHHSLPEAPMHGHHGSAVEADAHTDTRPWGPMIVALVAQVLVVIDISVVNTAMPTIGHELGLGSSDLQWVVTAYLLLSGGCLLLGGRIADLVSRRAVFLTGLTLFTAASLFTGFAGGAVELIAGRAAQGAAAALMTPAALSIISTTYTGKQKARGLALWGAIGGLGIAVGVALGGVLTTWASWEAIFWINVPIGVRRHRRHPPRRREGPEGSCRPDRSSTSPGPSSASVRWPP